MRTDVKLHTVFLTTAAFTALAACTNLASLYVSNNDLKSIDAVSNLPRIATLYADGNKLKVVRGLQNLKWLTSVSLSRNKITDVTPLTGYVRGGVTALACKKDYPVVIDESAQLFTTISVSAGQRGLQILLHPDDYARAVRGRYAPLAAPRPSGV